MTGFFVLFGGIALFATVVGIWDWIAERQNDKAHR